MRRFQRYLWHTKWKGPKYWALVSAAGGERTRCWRLKWNHLAAHSKVTFHELSRNAPISQREYYNSRSQTPFLRSRFLSTVQCSVAGWEEHVRFDGYCGIRIGRERKYTMVGEKWRQAEKKQFIKYNPDITLYSRHLFPSITRIFKPTTSYPSVRLLKFFTSCRLVHFDIIYYNICYSIVELYIVVLHLRESLQIPIDWIIYIGRYLVAFVLSAALYTGRLISWTDRRNMNFLPLHTARTLKLNCWI